MFILNDRKILLMCIHSKNDAYNIAYIRKLQSVSKKLSEILICGVYILSNNSAKKEKRERTLIQLKI